MSQKTGVSIASEGYIRQVWQMEDRAGRLVAAIGEKNEGYSERNRELPNTSGTQQLVNVFLGQKILLDSADENV